MKTIVTAMAAVAALAVSAGVVSAQDWRQPPNFGSVSLQTGFTPDPYNVNIIAGGSIDASRNISDRCRGYISNAPDFELLFTAGSSLPLVISANSSSDTTLVINGPDGSWYCDDDGGQQGLNPSLNFTRPASGAYHIWVGSYSAGQNPSATLSISELYTQ